MKITKFGLGLSVAASLCLMACGDDSNSTSPVEDAGNASSSSETSVTPASSADNDPSSSATETLSSSSVVVEAEPCTFEATDKVWEFSYTGTDTYNNNAKITTTYEIDGDDLVIRDSIRYTGNTASIYCRLSEGPSEQSSSDGKFSATQSCDGSTVVFVGTTRERGYIADNGLEKIHATVKKACDVAVNGGTYDVVPLETETTCNFALEDSAWSYSYLDEYWRGNDSVIAYTVVVPSEDLVLNISKLPMQHAECVSKFFASNSTLDYCGVDGKIEIASSGLSFDKESRYNMEKRTCMEKLPVPDKDDPDAEEVITVSGMVSCDIPGVMGECVEFPAGSSEAIAMKEQCETVLEGTLGTGCEN